MRVSSLSDGRIIAKVSDYFVPVWISRDHYQLGTAGTQDAAVLARIDSTRSKLKTPGGAVCVYIATADGEVVDTLIVHKAWQPQLLGPFLDRWIAAYKLAPRKSDVVQAARASSASEITPKAKTAGGQLFIVRTRFDDAGANRGISRDWVELTAEQWGTFVRAGKAGPGQRSKIPDAVARHLLQYAYPPLPHWNAKLSRVKKANLTARVVSADAAGAKLALEGDLELIYPDQGKPTDGTVTASLFGVAQVDLRTATLRSFTLVSREGQYLWHWNGKPQPRRMSLSIELAR